MSSSVSMDSVKMSKTWAMPNSKTFSIPPIRGVISKWISGLDVVIDPFANDSKLANITNDLDESHETDYHMDATDFLGMFPDKSVDAVLYDPPYSPRQVSECYRRLGILV